MRAAIVGLGWWGKQIVKCLKDSEKIDVTHGVDVNIDQVTAFGEEYGLSLSTELEPLLSDPEVDAFILATPHSLHEAQVISVASAGKQVFCEKPLALSAAAVRKMLAVCARKGIQLGVGHERRYEPAMERMKALADDGSLGKLLSLDANFSHDNFKNLSDDNWRLKSADSPAGAMTALGIHLTDMFISIAGRVTTVWAQTASRSFQAPAQDVVSVLLTFESGVTATMTCLSTTPFYGRMTVFGDKGWAELKEVSNVDIDDPAEFVVRLNDGSWQKAQFEAENAVLANFEAWADAVAGRAEYRFTNEQLVQNIEVLEAITKSAAENVPVRLADLR